jgi:UDP:flavonoid glycosyltransferase YjiC (YdhE family)
VLDDEGYRRAARRLKRAYGLRDGVSEIAALVDEVIAERAMAVDHA